MSTLPTGRSLNRGFELIDYQSLLLKQVIGYHSVELVNNFNLKPIKKRIAMMTKTKSGIPAKFKAILVIPFAIIAFLLFAEFTVKGPGNSLFNLNSSFTEEPAEADLKGLWVNGSPNGFSELVLISDDMFSYMEGDELSEYCWGKRKGELILSPAKGGGGIHLKATLSGNKLVIWWNDEMGIHYTKSEADNTMDLYLQKQDVKVELPYISQFRLMEKQNLVFKLCLGHTSEGKTALTFNGRGIDLSDLPGLVEMERAKHSKMDVNSLTAMFFFDTEVSMEEVVKVKQVLRKINSLKVAYAGYPEGDLAVSALQYHTVALPMLLPPMDAKLLDKEEIEKMGTRIFVIDLSARNTTPKDIDQNLEKFIRENEKGKYVFSLEYDGKIPYAQYIGTIDIVFNVVYRFRDEMAIRKFQVPYAQLGKDMQKEIRKAHPMVLSEAWAGE